MIVFDLIAIPVVMLLFTLLVVSVHKDVEERAHYARYNKRAYKTQGKMWPVSAVGVPVDEFSWMAAEARVHYKNGERNPLDEQDFSPYQMYIQTGLLPTKKNLKDCILPVCRDRWFLEQVCTRLPR